MRFATIELDAEAAWGIVEGEEIALIDRWTTLRQAIASGELAVDFR